MLYVSTKVANNIVVSYKNSSILRNFCMKLCIFGIVYTIVAIDNTLKSEKPVTLCPEKIVLS